MMYKDFSPSLRQQMHFNSDLSPAERKLKYEKMSRSPFAFYRGSNFAFWAEFYDPTTPQETITWIGGDQHPANFGVYTFLDGRIVFGLNDCDDAVKADFRYDLLRMSTGIHLVAKANRLSMRDGYRASLEFVRAYTKQLELLKRKPFKASSVTLVNSAPQPLSLWMKSLRAHYPWSKNGRFISAPKKFSPVNYDEFDIIESAIGPKINSRVVDIVRRIGMGTGSLGVERFFLLANDGIVWDIKETNSATAHGFLEDKDSQSNAERAATAIKNLIGHKLAFAVTVEIPKVSGTKITYKTLHLLVKQYDQMKASYPLTPEELEKGGSRLSLGKTKNLRAMCRVWGGELARAHVRAMQKDSSINPNFVQDALILCGDKIRFASVISNQGYSFAKKTFSDYREFVFAHQRGLL
jgi:uncharacterized protein (DUF2252 family)